MPKSIRDIAAFMDNGAPSPSLRHLMNIHTSNPKGWRSVMGRHTHPSISQFRLLFLNTYLLEVGLDGGFGSKPVIDKRSAEIGRLIRDRYDLAALTEVFRNEERKRILKQWPDSQRPFDAEFIHKRIIKSAGLMTISQRSPIVYEEKYEFKFEKGIDAWADKGVLLARIDLGMGPSTLDIYSTHLNAESDFIQRMQLIELAEFVRTTRAYHNPTLIMGDLNMGDYSERKSFPDQIPVPTGSPQYFKYKLKMKKIIEPSPFFNLLVMESRNTPFQEQGGLYERDVIQIVMKALGFQDLWRVRTKENAYGYTSQIDEKGVADAICKLDLRTGLVYQNEHVHVGYCEDDGLPKPPYYFKKKKKTDRLDYIFFYVPESSSFHLDFSRPRRLRMERKGKKFGWLSDHLGLETTLLISPKS